MKNNITLHRFNNDIFNQDEMTDILNDINQDDDLNSQKFKSKKIVSFYDDDLICHFVLRIPHTGDFDIKMLDLCDYFGVILGITNCKYDGEFLQ